jgi:hypothetical protein
LCQHHWQQCYSHLLRGLQVFRKAIDLPNTALVLCNLGKLMRINAHFYRMSAQQSRADIAHSDAPDATEHVPSSKELQYREKALAMYGEAFSTFTKRDDSAVVYDVVNMEVAKCHFALAQQMECERVLNKEETLVGVLHKARHHYEVELSSAIVDEEAAAQLVERVARHTKKPSSTTTATTLAVDGSPRAASSPGLGGGGSGGGGGGGGVGGVSDGARGGGGGATGNDGKSLQTVSAQLYAARERTAAARERVAGIVHRLGTGYLRLQAMQGLSDPRSAAACLERALDLYEQGLSAYVAAVESEGHGGKRIVDAAMGSSPGSRGETPSKPSKSRAYGSVQAAELGRRAGLCVQVRAQLATLRLRDSDPSMWRAGLLGIADGRPALCMLQGVLACMSEADCATLDLVLKDMHRVAAALLGRLAACAEPLKTSQGSPGGTAGVKITKKARAWAQQARVLTAMASTPLEVLCTDHPDPLSDQRDEERYRTLPSSGGGDSGGVGGAGDGLDGAAWARLQATAVRVRGVRLLAAALDTPALRS